MIRASRRHAVARPGPRWAHGQADGVRAPHHRGARHPVRAAVVHRRARHAQVGRGRAGRARGRLRRGHRVRRLGHRGLRPRLRVRHARQARPRTFQVLPWRGESPGTGRMFCDILMPDGSAVLRRPAARAQAGAGQGRRPRASPSTPTPRSSSSCFSRASPNGRGPDAGRRGRLLRPQPARRRATTSAARRSRCSRRWASRWSSATTRARPASRRSTCATPTRSPRPTTS